MPRERADYRDLLERLDMAFPGKELLSKTEIAAWLGVNASTVSRRYRLPKGSVLKTTVARAISGT